MLDRGLRRHVPAAGRAEAGDAGRASRRGTGRAATSPTCRRSRSIRQPRRTSTTRSRPSARTATACASGSTSPTSARTCGRAARSSARPTAARRSVYVPGAVEPMLPEALSNEACSLVPGEPRNAVTVEMRDGRRGRRVGRPSTASLIRSDKRLTYDEVDEMFAGQARRPRRRGASRSPPPARWRRALAGAARARGALAVESSEPQFEFDDDGHVVGVHREAQTESHRADRAPDDPRERAGREVPRRAQGADALPRARAARPAGGRVAGRAARRRSTSRRRRCPST